MRHAWPLLRESRTRCTNVSAKTIAHGYGEIMRASGHAPLWLAPMWPFLLAGIDKPIPSFGTFRRDHSCHMRLSDSAKGDPLRRNEFRPEPTGRDFKSLRGGQIVVYRAACGPCGGRDKRRLAEAPTPTHAASGFRPAGMPAWRFPAGGYGCQRRGIFGHDWQGLSKRPRGDATCQ
jgi:hypothetical protein